MSILKNKPFFQGLCLLGLVSYLSVAHMKVSADCSPSTFQARSGHLEFAENALDGAIAAFDGGANVVHLDIQQSNAGLIFHRDQMTGRVVRVPNQVGSPGYLLTQGDWRIARMVDRDGNSTTYGPSTTFDLWKLGDSLKPGKRLNLEIRSDSQTCNRLTQLDELIPLKNRSDNLIFSSMSRKMLACAKKHSPRTPLAMVLAPPEAAIRRELRYDLQGLRNAPAMLIGMDLNKEMLNQEISFAKENRVKTDSGTLISIKNQFGAGTGFYVHIDDATADKQIASRVKSAGLELGIYGVTYDEAVKLDKTLGYCPAVAQVEWDQPFSLTARDPQPQFKFTPPDPANLEQLKRTLDNYPK